MGATQPSSISPTQNKRPWKPLKVPFQGPIVSMAGSKDTLWAIRAWSELWRFRKGEWKQMGLPGPVYVEPPVAITENAAWIAWIWQAYPVWLCILLTICTGVFAGALNGLLITSLRMMPFIITLGIIVDDAEVC